MSFGLMQGRVIIMIIISVLFLGLLWYFRKEFRDCQFSLMLLATGTIGNLIDRVFRGYVIDFFDLGWFPVFNLSDAMITLGTIGIIYAFLIDLKKEMKYEKNQKIQNTRKVKLKQNK
jgi:signal peptidase II